MSFKKKLLVGLLAVVSAVACTFGAFGCFGNKNPSNDNNTPDTGNVGDNGNTGDNGNKEEENKGDGKEYETVWSSDGDYHWHASLDGIGDDGKKTHDWVEQTSLTVAASCTHAGSKEYKCSVCDATKSETIAQLSHKWGETKTVAATCTTAGYEYKECTLADCSERTVVKQIAANGHTPITEATCLTGSKCKDCGVTISPALGHNYVLKSSQAATCTAEGKETYQCKGCNDTYETVVSAPKGHNVEWDERGFETFVGTKEVCYEIEYEGHCTNEGCNHTETKTTEITNHVFVGTIVAEATCSQTGLKAVDCTECQLHTEQQLAKVADAHSWDNGTTSGNITTFRCTESGCSHTKQSIVYTEKTATVPVSELKTAGEVKLDNTTIALDDGVQSTISGSNTVNLSAETLNAGDLGMGNVGIGDSPVYDLKLSVGGELVSELGGYVTVTVPYELSEGEDPDHIIILYINGEKLEEVEGTYANGFVTFKTNHFSYYTVTRMNPRERCELFGHAYTTYSEPATCLSTGYEVVFCTRCGDKSKVNIPALGHDWEQSVVTEATCTAAGKTHYGCKREGCTTEYDVVNPAIGHDWVATVYVEATCTADGNATYKCENCSEEYSVKFAQTPHTFKITTVAATCTTGGYKLNVCTTCGHKNETDHVDALGHTEATKNVAPTCTADGFTLKYCSTCGEELARSNVVKATGHNMVNGVCSVCGYGCNHIYVDGNVVEPTCTEDGYTVFTCKICKNSYNGNIVKATGHFYNADECTICHKPNPALNDYYLNLFDTSIGGSFTVTLNDLVFKEYARTYEDGNENEKVYGNVKQIDVTTVTLGISPTGEITGSGRGNVSVEAEGETVVIECKIAVIDGKMYVVVDSDTAHLVPSMYISMGLDYIFGNMSGGKLDVATFRDYIRWYNTSVNPIINDLINTNADLAVNLIRLVMNTAFDSYVVEDGYNYVLNAEGVMALNEQLYNTTVSDVVNKLLKEKLYLNSGYDMIPDMVPVILNLSAEKVLENMGTYGLDKDMICSAVDAFMFLYTGEKFDSAAMLKAMLEENDGAYNKMTVAELIIAKEGLEVEVKDFIDGVTEKVTEALKANKDKTVYDIITKILYDAKVIPVSSAGELYDMVCGTLGQYINMANMFTASFATDKEGNVVSAVIDIDVRNYYVGSGSSDVPSDKPIEGDYEKPYASESIYVDMSGKLQFTFGETAVIDKDMIAQITAAKPTFEKNAVITVYSDKDYEKEYDNYWGLPELVTYSRSREMRIHTDAKGNIVKIVKMEERLYRNVETVFGSYYRCNEEIYYSINEYDVVDGAMLSVSEGYCGNTNSYSIVCNRTGYDQHEYYSKTYRVRTNQLISDVILDKDVYNQKTYQSSVNFYYNPATKQFMPGDPHSYENLVVNKDKSDERCGGFYYIECKEEGCDYHYERHIEHLNNKFEYVYELVEGATSCEDGLLRKYVCEECGEAVRTDKLSSHYTYRLGEIDLSQYGAGCGHTIYVYGCICGYYLSTRLDYGYPYNKEYGKNCDSFKYQGYYGYDSDGDGKADREVVLYSCYVTDCAFNFAFYTDSVKDEHCWVTRYHKFMFGVTVDRENRLVSGGEVYDKYENKPLAYSYGYQHNTVEDKKETPTGYIIENTCKDCGLKIYKEEYSVVEDKANYTTVKTVIRTYYKNDVDDNTVENVDKYVHTEVYNAVGNIVKDTEVYEYYRGEISDSNLINIDEYIHAYSYDAQGRSSGYVYERNYYGSNALLYNRHTENFVTVWVEGTSFDFLTESKEEYDFYDKEGNYSETPSRWHKYEYDYSKGYCSPIIKESTQAGASDPREDYVNHYPYGQYIIESTCTQCGTRECAFCHKEVQDGEPHGHWYNYEGVCEYCGLQNSTNIDGRVELEDLSYTSETDYVIGYFNRESASYTFRFALVDPEKDDVIFIDFDRYIDSNEDIEELNYRRSGTVRFAVADIASVAVENGFSLDNNYMIQVIFVSNMFGSQLDYAITIDAHNWVEGQMGIDGVLTADFAKYCAKCGMVHGVGYLNWNVDVVTEDLCMYYAYKDGKKYELTLFGGSYIEDVEIKNGDIVLKKNYTLVAVKVDGYDVSESELESYKAQYTLVFNDLENGVFGGMNFTYYYDGQFVLSNGTRANWYYNGAEIQITINEYNYETQNTVSTTFYFKMV